jgi:hypothetical protein
MNDKKAPLVSVVPAKAGTQFQTGCGIRPRFIKTGFQLPLE